MYTYTDIHFTRGEKKIDPIIAEVNLLDFKKCMDQHTLTFGLIYGTLLGAIREKGFIAHDEDTDLFVLLEDRKNILAILFDLRKSGFEVGRYNGELLTIVRDGEYIDLYFFRKQGFFNRECDGYVVPNHMLTNPEPYQFLGTSFNVPKNPEKLLNKLYGENWRVPDKNGSTINYGFSLKSRIYIRDNLRPLFDLLSWTKHKIYA